jgi:hypothetical protein
MKISFHSRLVLAYSLTCLLSLHCFADSPPERKGPFDYQQVFELPVGYYIMSTNYFVPAYIQGYPPVVYLWANVVLPGKDIPPSPVLEPSPVHHFHYSRGGQSVYQIIPQMFFMPNDTLCEMGYYTKRYNTFYRWRGVTFERDAIPVEYDAKEILETRDSIRIVDIDAPSGEELYYFNGWTNGLRK